MRRPRGYRSVAFAATATGLALTAGLIVTSPSAADQPIDPGESESPSAPESPVTPTEPTKPVVECLNRVPKLKKKYWNKVPQKTKQIVLVEGRSMKSIYSKVIRWEKRGQCWIKLSTYSSYNGYKGWAVVPWTGGMRTPIGTYRLTDAGGRLPNPGTKMRYHYGPQAYGAGGYAMNRSKLQIFDYVVAVNYNRRAGSSPRFGKVMSKRKATGYWFHVMVAGPTKGCVSMDRADMKALTSWLNPAKRPVTIQGPKTAIYS